MPKIPTVAIITRTRNRNHLLQRAIKSVLQQTMGEWHHWIVNDGGDAEPIQSLLDENADVYSGRCSLLDLKHAGMQAAANAAIAESDSEFVVIHDDDDAWHPEFLEATTAFLRTHGTGSKYQGVISRTERVLEEQQADGSFRELERVPYVPLKTISLDRVGYENPFPPIAFVYRRSVLKQLKGYDIEWDLVADLDFNFRFLKMHDIGVVDRVLAYYHWREQSDNRDSMNSVTLQKSRHEQLLNRLKNHYLRDASSTADSTMALAYLVSSYAVENQWMTSEIRDRSILFKEKLESLLEGSRVTQRFSEKSVWPKLEELSQSLHLTNNANSQLEEIRKFNNDAAWPKLQELDGLLQLAGDASRQLEEIRKFNNDAAWPKLEANESANHAILERLEKYLGQLEELHKRLEPINRLETIQSMLKGLKSQQDEILNNQEQLNVAMAEVREEIEKIRDETGRDWRLGPFRIKRAPQLKGDATDSTGG